MFATNWPVTRNAWTASSDQMLRLSRYHMSTFNIFFGWDHVTISNVAYMWYCCENFAIPIKIFRLSILRSSIGCSDFETRPTNILPELVRQLIENIYFSTILLYPFIYDLFFFFFKKDSFFLIFDKIQYLLFSIDKSRKWTLSFSCGNFIFI
jgi:hypothetical protein